MTSAEQLLHCLQEWTGVCSRLTSTGRGRCTLPIGHAGAHAVVPKAKRQCCPRCGNWILPGRDHACGEGVCL